MRLHSGSSVPPFRLPAIDGSEFDLRTTAGTRLFLAFFRFATCPFCNLRMHELVTRLPELGGACRVVAIFDSPVDHLREHAGRHELRACEHAEGAIIGSALIRALADVADVPAAAGRFVRGIKQA